MSADLHVHTTHSDGSLSPGEVVRAAASHRLAALAITDHDTVSALAIAQPEADRLGLELVAGIELTAADTDGREIHVLGHFFRADDPGLLDTTARLREARTSRALAMVERLAGLGLKVDLGALRRAFPKAAIGRKLLADWLVRSGQVANRREVFARYLGDDGPANVPKLRLNWSEAICLIREAGGVAGLAHPPRDTREVTLCRYVEAGLGSIEVAGPGIGRAHSARFRSWARTLDLVPIAGSDFHAPDRSGTWVGAITTPSFDLERLRERAGRSHG